MKVLFLTTVPSPYRVDFFEELGKKCELTVLYEGKYVNYREKSWMKINSKNYISNYLKGKIINGQLMPRNLKKHLFGNKYDIYVISGYATVTSILSILFLKFYKKPFILSCDGAIQSNENKFKYMIKKFLISSAHFWLSSGKVTQDYLLHYGAKKEKIYFYPFTSVHDYELVDNVINNDIKRHIRNKLNIKEEKVIVTVGQFIYRKGIDLLLKASKEFSEEYGVYIIGGDPPNEYLDYVKKNKLKNIHFETFKVKEEILEYYKSADLFVLPTREDIWGLVINEAMACGLPVITTDMCVAGLELIKNMENGYIVPSEDSTTLSRQINNYFSNKNNYLKMSLKCIEMIKPYTIENMAKVHFEIFNKIIYK
ncbi:glycosyltransferase family 4 protein [Clostridium perfringens]|nr:glycosyltransferase family 4 protein [Clostridium perfringens]